MTIHLIDPPPKDPQIYAQAADWLVRLRDTDFDPEEPYTNLTERRREFWVWARQSPAHVRAFMEIAQTYHTIGPSIPGVAAGPAPPCLVPRIVPRTLPRQLRRIVSCTLPRELPRPRLQPRVASHPVTLCLALIVCLIAPVPVTNMRVHSGTPELVYQAAQPGERKVITLADGSNIYLNTAARILIMDSKNFRGVQLLSGEALFEIQHSATPFRVFVDDVVVEDRGTEFSVRRDHSDIRIAVTEGLVQLHCGGRQSALQGGQRVDISRDRSAAVRGSVTPELAREIAAERDGVFIFRQVPLAEVVRQFNHYNRRQLVLADPRLESFEVGATIHIHDIDALIAAMRDLFGVTVVPPSGSETDPDVIKLVRGD